MSKEYKLYLKKIKINKLLVILCQIILIIILLIIWQFLANKNIINTFITSSPKRVINTVLSLYKENNLFNNIWITIYETDRQSKFEV